MQPLIPVAIPGDQQDADAIIIDYSAKIRVKK